MLVVAENLFGASGVQDRVPGASFANGAEFVAYVRGAGFTALAHQALAEGVDYSLGKAFTGCGGEFPGQAVGFGMFDAQGHGSSAFLYF